MAELVDAPDSKSGNLLLNFYLISKNKLNYKSKKLS